MYVCPCEILTKLSNPSYILFRIFITILCIPINSTILYTDGRWLQSKAFLKSTKTRDIDFRHSSLCSIMCLSTNTPSAHPLASLKLACSSFLTLCTLFLKDKLFCSIYLPWYWKETVCSLVWTNTQDSLFLDTNDYIASPVIRNGLILPHIDESTC